MNAQAWHTWAREAAEGRKLSPAAAHLLLLLAGYVDWETGVVRVRRDKLLASFRRGKSVYHDALAELVTTGLVEHRRAAPGRAAGCRLLHIDSGSPEAIVSGPPDPSRLDVSGPPDPSRLDVSGPPDPKVRPAGPESPARRNLYQSSSSPSRKTAPNPALAGSDDLPIPVKPTGNRRREQEAFEQQVAEYSAARFGDIDEPMRSQYVRYAIGNEPHPTHESLEACVRRWAPQARSKAA